MASKTKVKLPREGILALISASYELERNGTIELDNIFTESETRTTYMGVPNFGDRTITLNISYGAFTQNTRAEQITYTLEQVLNLDV